MAAITVGRFMAPNAQHERPTWDENCDPLENVFRFRVMLVKKLEGELATS
jgi:hypothetical protein